MKKSVKITLISVSLVLICYIVLCLCISFKVNKILDESFKSYGEVNIFSDDISDNLFSAMCYRNDVRKEDNAKCEKNWRSFPITILWLNTATSWYWYEYSSTFNSSKTDPRPIAVHLELKNFRWVVTDMKYIG